MSNKYVIDSNVPVSSPVRHSKSMAMRAYKHKWPLTKLKVGESFFVPLTELSENVQNGFDYPTHNVTSVIHNHRKAIGLKATFTTREVVENNARGVRVWRKK